MLIKLATIESYPAPSQDIHLFCRTGEDWLHEGKEVLVDKTCDTEVYRKAITKKSIRAFISPMKEWLISVKIYLKP